MSKFDPLAAIELQQFVTEYWAELDSNRARAMADFYLDDCSFSAGRSYSGNGKEGVRKFYEERAKLVAGEKDGIRTTRHVYANFGVSFEVDGTALVQFVLTNYSGGGNPPITAFAGPSMVAEVTLKCRRGAQGDWKIASFRGTPLFIANEDFTQKFLSETEGIG